jgi:hypothetical protein
MKKIMFNDRFFLTDAVLEGRKTMTRRIVNDKVDPPRYKIGEIVAVAQSYIDCYNNEGSYELQYGLETFIMRYDKKAHKEQCPEAAPGWSNKMYVRADLMPHHIRITNVRTERLHDISEEDCIKEGIEEYASCCECGSDIYTFQGAKETFLFAEEAFEALFKKISGKKVWDKNPYVYVYEFVLID